MVNSVSSSLTLSELDQQQQSLRREDEWSNRKRDGARSLGEVRTGVEAKVNQTLACGGMSVCN